MKKFFTLSLFVSSVVLMAGTVHASPSDKDVGKAPQIEKAIYVGMKGISVSTVQGYENMMVPTIGFEYKGLALAAEVFLTTGYSVYLADPARVPRSRARPGKPTTYLTEYFIPPNRATLSKQTNTIVRPDVVKRE